MYTILKYTLLLIIIIIAIILASCVRESIPYQPTLNSKYDVGTVPQHGHFFHLLEKLAPVSATVYDKLIQ
jgi:hypothetical protein